MPTPFSSNEIINLRELIEKNGWRLDESIENLYRYSIHKNKFIIFSLKIPVGLPIKLNIPFEVICFRISLAFKLWNLDQKAYKFIIYLMKVLKNLTTQNSIEHNFIITDKERSKLIELLTLIIPESIKDEDERAWLNRIRISLNNKREPFKKMESKYLMNIIEELKKIGLKPTFNQPWELKKGLPKIRTSETLFFSNNVSSHDEFFILEKGFFSYFIESDFNKFLVRSFFETYAPYILWKLYDEYPEFQLQSYVQTWIKYTQLMFNSVIEILKSAEINPNDFIQFRPEKELELEEFEENINNFSFSALHYENLISKELYPLKFDSLNVPPDDFEVIESISFLNDAETLYKAYKFQQASVLYEEALKIFNKQKQKKIVILILLKLRKIASLLNQDNIALNYLKSALEVAKSGEIPIEFIIKIHYKLGKLYYKTKEYDNALNHFNILSHFLQSEEVPIENIEKDEILGMTALYMGLSNLTQNKIPEAKLNFKKAFNIGVSRSAKVKLKYYLYRARYLKEKKKFSQMLRFLKMAFVGTKLEDETCHKIILDLLFELCEIYIYFKKDIKKSFYYLDTSNKLLTKKSIPELFQTYRWNLLMSDYYKLLLKDNENSAYYQSQSRIIRAQLNVIGIKN